MTLESMRISRPVEALVMLFHRVAPFAEPGEERSDQTRARLGMTMQNSPFCFGGSRRLIGRRE
jgi:hypothetical protein